MITETVIRNSLIDAISEDVKVVRLPSGALSVATPFGFADGDLVNIIVKEAEDGSLILTDEADTLAHLTYFDFTPRVDVLDKILMSYAIENRNGRLVMPDITPEMIGEAVFDFAHALSKVADMALWKRERTQSQFISDFQNIITSVVDCSNITFGYNPPDIDPDELYMIDCFVRMPSTSVCIYAAYNDMDTKESALSISHYKNSGSMDNVPHCIVFNPEGNISKRSMKQACNVANRTFGSLNILDRDLSGYFKEVA